MQIGMIGLGRMGSNMVRRLLAAGHDCVVFDRNSDTVAALITAHATGTSSVREFVAALHKPRLVWIMIPAAAVDDAIAELATWLDAGDVIVDGGNSHYVDDLRRAAKLSAAGIHYVDVGVSGGVWGLENGYCQMIGGEAPIVERLRPIFAALAPGSQAGLGDAAAGQTARDGYLHCGPSGAGHFVKMVHNGIEYGLMAAYAEGINILRHANVGQASRRVDAETSPLGAAEHFAYDFDLGQIAEVWRHGSVIRSWLLDLVGAALARDPRLDEFAGKVADSGEGRWTVNAAIEAGVPVPVLATALFARFSSRGAEDFANRVLSAMRYEFGGHPEPGHDQRPPGR
ncbi:MAG TPA: decarboxylating 6-phosphogluconate dehydrogenase [Gammaproteobacteria bacterium]|nr:decarboxylating 6-phosphogluconate dehydrogenase [Gammaproteobacteria bacterium]